MSFLWKTPGCDDLSGRNVDKEIVDRLRVDGHDVPFIAEAEPGADDQTVLVHAE